MTVPARCSFELWRVKRGDCRQACFDRNRIRVRPGSDRRPGIGGKCEGVSIHGVPPGPCSPFTCMPQCNESESLLLHHACLVFRIILISSFIDMDDAVSRDILFARGETRRSR